jgi:hypothetical protein
MELVELLYPIAVLLAPLIAYWRLQRRPNISRRDVLIGTTLAGSGVTGLLAVGLLVAGAPFEGVLPLWPWVFVSGAIGFVLGLLLLLARSAGGWLSNPP